jgi:hypothetical protein
VLGFAHGRAAYRWRAPLEARRRETGGGRAIAFAARETGGARAIAFAARETGGARAIAFAGRRLVAVGISGVVLLVGLR